ncbi:MAG: PilZ domain-containing protein [Nitrospirota bacterium]
MDGKRAKKRFRKEIAVRFGTTLPDHLGLIHDISTQGIFIKASRIFQQQTRLVIEIKESTSEGIKCEGVVKWAKRVPLALATLVQKNGMGILLTNNSQEYTDLITRIESAHL